MLSPGRKRVAGQALRGTTAPLSATAMPRAPVSTAFSASNAASVVGAPSGSLSPFTRMWASLIGFSKSLRRARRQKALQAERLYRRLDDVIEDQARHRIRRHRRQKDAVAVVAG